MGIAFTFLFLAALAYRTQKALRDASPSFGTFQAGQQVRSPVELVRHMTSVLGYARTFFVGGRYRPEPLPDLAAEAARFHQMLQDLSDHLAGGTPLRDMSEERLLQGPLADAMTHAGQLAMLRRLSGSPVAPENFIEAAIEIFKSHGIRCIFATAYSDGEARRRAEPAAPLGWLQKPYTMTSLTETVQAAAREIRQQRRK